MKKLIKKTVLVAILLTVCFSFSACQKESFNPKQKIKKIYLEALPMFPKTLMQEFFWEKNQLTKIVTYLPALNTEQYIYEKNKLVRVEDPSMYSLITYDGSKYEKVETYDKNGTLLTKMDFSYNNNKVDKITITSYIAFLFCNTVPNGFISSLIPQEFIVSMAERAANAHSAKANYEFVYVVKYKWSGDNISEAVMEDEGGLSSMTMSYTYDKMNNPFYKYTGMRGTSVGAVAAAPVSTKNNILEMKMKDSEPPEGESKINYSYKYEKNYPVEIEVSGGDIPENPTKQYYEY